MNLKTIIVKLLCLTAFSCGNYDMGFEDGYEDSKKKTWILFGKTEYTRGYIDGKFDAWCGEIKETDYKRYKKECLEEQK